ALDQLDHPARIEVDAKADPPSMLCQMFDRQPEPPGTARPEHQPVASLGKLVVGKRLAEHLVVDLPIVDLHTTFGNTRGTAGLKDIDRFALEPLGNPTLDWSAPQPFVFELGEFLQVVETM